MGLVEVAGLKYAIEVYGGGEGGLGAGELKPVPLFFPPP